MPLTGSSADWTQLRKESLDWKVGYTIPKLKYEEVKNEMIKTSGFHFWFPLLERVHNSREAKDFPAGPVVKNPPCYAGDTVQFLVRELRSHMPQNT